MSDLTASLLNCDKPRNRRRWQRRFSTVADRLVAAYGVPRLGNYKDPVREIFYIVLSAKTADAQYRKTNAALTSRFSTLADLADAAVADVAACIEGGGLANKKASQLKRIAAALLALGDAPARAMRAMSAEALYRFLTSLPGVGPKSALCILMCSFSLDVFPVDVNVSRIAVRFGAAAPDLKHYHYQSQLPPLVPQGRSKELHVGLVVHGRTVCLPREPKCGQCQLVDLCEMGRKRVGRQPGEANG